VIQFGTRGGTIKKALTPAVALAAALAMFVVLAPHGDAAPAKALANSLTFPDSSAEDPLGPDISSITVSNDDKGSLTLVVNIPNRPQLTGDMLIEIYIDSDNNAATGSPQLLGVDYVIQLDALGGPAGVGMFRWNGTDYVATGVPQASLIFSYTNGATIKISNAELGGTTRFNFIVVALSGLVITPTGELDDTNAHFDVSPDPGHGLNAYEVKTVPPALVVKSFGTRPVKPRPSGSYTVNLLVARNDAAPIENATLACKATLGGKALAPSGRTLVGTRASCTWTIPAKKTKGKTIRGTITVQSGSLKATRSFSATVG
jgi:hypothetical protein